MTRLLFCLALILVASSVASAAIVEHSFHADGLVVNDLGAKPHSSSAVHCASGEWWNANVVDVETQALATGTQPNNSDAFTINGLPGDLYPCSQNTDQEVGSYYMAANAYVSDGGAPLNSTTRGIVLYEGSPTTATPMMPLMPAFNDTPTTHKFFTTITGLAGGPHWVPVPRKIDEYMFVTVSMGLSICPTCLNGTRLSASMNNYSFVSPYKPVHAASLLF
ncbi:hypothetical protein OIU76_010049 [Salix suchowensis]|nr:hypothetical protein OIU76_010049 [Salix suchowensis]